MTTIIAGTGLGLFNTSANLLGSAGNPLSGRPGQSDAVYINSATGNLVIQAQDEFLASIGLDTSLVRTYNSRGQTNMDGDNNDNWRMSTAALVSRPGSPNTAGTSVTKRFGDGAEVTYTFDTTRNLYVSTAGDGADDTLQFAGGVWTWTDGSELIKETYDSNGRLTAIKDRDGITTTFTYPSGLNVLITKVGAQPSENQTLLLDYAGANKLQSIKETSQGVTQTLVTYGYDTANRLTSVKVDLTPTITSDNKTYITTYTYDPIDATNKRVASITNGDTSAVSFLYDSLGRVKTYTDGAGKITTIDYPQVLSVTNLNNRDTANPEWSIQQNMQVGNTTYGDRAHTLAAVSASVAGSTWIRPAGDSKSFTGNPLVSFSINVAADVFVAVDDRVGRLPWMDASWVDTGEEIVNRESSTTTRPYSLFRKSFTAGTVSLGPQANSTAATYLTIIKATGGGNTITIPTSADVRGLTTPASTTALLSASTIANALSAQFKFGENGNGIAMWLANFDVWVSTYNKASDTWSAPSIINGGITGSPDTANPPHLSMSENGNALVTWIQAGNVYAKRYTKATNTWSSIALLENQGFAAVKPIGAINNTGRAVVAFVNWDGSANNLYTNVFNGTGWQSNAVKIDDLGGADNKDIDALMPRPALAIDQNGNATALWLQKTPGTGTLTAARFSRYTASSNSWSNVDSTTLNNGVVPPKAVDAAQITFDGSGNGVAVWLQDGSLYAKSFTASTNSWSSATTLGAATATPSLALSSNGNGVVAWVNGTDVLARRYAAGVWQGSSPEAIETLAGQAYNPTASINNNGQAAVAFVQDAGGVRNVYANRFSGGTWQSGATLLESNTNTVATTMTPAVALDATGMAEVVWTQRNTATNTDGVFTNRFASEAFYKVKAGDTWATIAQATYGDSNAANALQVALGNPTLVTGLVLTGFPPRLDYLKTIAVNRTDVIDPLMQKTSYFTDTKGLLRQVSTTVNGVALETTYVYDTRDNVIQVVDGNQNRVNSFYDANDNLILSRDAAGNTVSFTYNAANQVATESCFLTPDPDNFGPQPPTNPVTTRYVYDSENHLRFIVSGEGRVTENRYDTPGNLVTTIVYKASSFNLTGRGPTDVLSEQQLNDWIAAQVVLDPNFRTKTERTDFTVDFRGQVSSAIVYGTIGTNGAGVIDGKESVTKFIYDQRGQLLQTIDARGESTADPNDHVTNYTYDGLGRLLTMSQWVSASETRATLTAYDDANNKVTLTLANGLATTSVFDKRGLLVSVSQADGTTALGTTTYQYDGAGQLRFTVDPIGNKNHRLYDAAGRMVALINATGAIVENVYDKTSNLVRTIAYATALSADQLASLLLLDANGNPLKTLADVRPANDPNRRITRFIYDTANRLVMTITPDDTDATKGFVTQTIYDGAGRVTETVAYATRVDLSGLPAVPTPTNISPLITSSADDRHARSFYDNDGQLIGTLDGEGAFCEYQYNAAGELVHKIHYAKPAQVSLRASGSFAQLQANVSAPNLETPNDQHSYNFYNAKGQLIATLDAENFLTEYVYDAVGNQTEVRRFYTTANPFSGVETVAQLRPAAHLNDAVTLNDYNGANQLFKVTQNPAGIVTFYTYNNVGQLIQTDRALNTEEVRTTQTRYDLQGRVLQTLTGEGSQALAALGANPTPAQIEAIWSQYGVRYTYDQAGRQLSATDQNGNATLFYYDADNRLRYTVNALGEVTETRYNAFGEVAETLAYTGRINTTGLAGGAVTPALTNAIAAIATPDIDAHASFNYTLRGAVKDAIEALDTTTSVTMSYTYNAFGETVSRLDPLTNDGTRNSTLTKYSYDRRGLLAQTIQDADNGAVVGLKRTTGSVYDAFGRATQTTDANGNLRIFAYDRLGRTVNVIDPMGFMVSTSTYDAFSRILTQADAFNNTIAMYEYLDIDRGFILTTGENIEIQTVFNAHGQTQSVTDGNGVVTSYEYDKNGQLTKTTNTALNISTSATYDRAMRLATTVDANNTVTTLTYDAANRIITRTLDPITDDHPEGLELITNYTYDGQGRTLTVTDPNGTVTRMDYDANGQLTQRTVDPSGLSLVTTFFYDPHGNVFNVTDPNLNDTAYTFDALGRRTSETSEVDGELVVTNYAYDDNGNLISKTDANGNICRYVYDANDRLVYTVDQLDVDAEFSSVKENRYDANGRVIQTILYETAITIDLTGPLGLHDVQELIEGGLDRIEHRTYDLDGRLARTITINMLIDDTVVLLGEVTKYRYDGNGNVIERISYANPIEIAGFESGALPDTLPDTLPDPIADSLHDRRVRMIYDAANRAIFTITDTTSVDETEIAVIEHRYDGNGNVVDRIEYANIVFPDTDTITADNITSMLSPDGSIDRHLHMVYDAANRVTFTLNGLGGLTQQVYDNNSNVVKAIQYAIPSSLDEITLSEDDRITVMTYDAVNRKIFTVNALGAVVEQVYDNNGNVLQKIAYAQVIEEPPTRDGIYTTDIIRGFVSLDDPDNRLTFATYDAFNRAVLLVDALGDVVQSEYDAVGNLVQSTAYAKSISLEGMTAENAAALLSQRLEDDGLAADTAHNRVTKRQYDTRNRLLATMDPLGFVTRNQYNTSGAVILTTQFGVAIPTSTEPSDIIDTVKALPDFGQVRDTSFFYDAAGHLIQSIDPMGFTEAYTYDGVGNRLVFTNKNGAQWLYDYDAAGRLTREISPEVNLTTLTQTGEMGALSVDADNSGSASVVTLFEHDALGNLTFRTEAFGRPEQRTTAYEYDALGRQVKTIFPSIAVYDSGTDNLLTNGANGLAERKEVLKELFSQVTYDALGNAISNLDVAGNRSYKTYDKVGRVDFEFDAEGGVTYHGRNAFGEETALTRFAAVHPTMLTGIGQTSLTSEQIVELFTGEGDDRTIITERDLLGRAITVTEPDVFVYDPDFVAADQYFTAGKTTRTSYNAFGEVFQVVQLKTPETDTTDVEWNYLITNYYDQNGRLIQQVDTMGYITDQEYDAVGNLTKRTEFEPRLVDFNGSDWDGAAPSADPITFDGEAPPGRITEYTYDLNNRKTSMTRKNIEFADETTIAPGDQTKRGIFTTTGDLTTSYGYDKVGNLTRTTDPTGASTFTYYDALGRITATAAPTRDGVVDPFSEDPNLKNPQTLRSVSAFFNDALSNVVAKFDYSIGALASADEQFLVFPLFAIVNPARKSFTKYDAQGHGTQTTDAAGVNHYASYNELGKIAKAWQGVTDSVLGLQTAFQAYRYDKVGRLIMTIDPPPTSDIAMGAPGRTFSWVTLPLPLPVGFNRFTGFWNNVIDPTGGAVRISFKDSSGVTVTSETFANPLVIEGGVDFLWEGSGGPLTDVKVEQQFNGVWLAVYPTNEAISAPITFTLYNSFGEMVLKLLAGTGAPLLSFEYYRYDNAGRMYLTNAGDGVDKFTLYDLEGNATAQIVSGGNGGNNVDLKTLGGAGATAEQAELAAANLTNVRRTDNFYDALGRVEKTIQPERPSTVYKLDDGQYSVGPAFVSSSVFQPKGTGPTQIAAWNGQNQVNVNVGTISVDGKTGGLALLGSGEVKVELDYVTKSYTFKNVGHPGVAKSRTFYVPAEEQDQTMEFKWTDPDGTTTGGDGGLASITRIRIYKKNLQGEWVAMGTATPQAASTSPLLLVRAPLDGSTIRFRIPSGGGFFSLIPENFGDVVRFDIPFGDGTYAYMVDVTSPDGSNREVATGNVTIAGTTATLEETTSDEQHSPRPEVHRTFDRWGNALSVTDPRNAAWMTEFAYNSDNKLTRITAPAQAGVQPVSDMLYDKVGRSFGTVESHDLHFDAGLGQDIFEHNVNWKKHDADGNVIEEHHADGAVVTHSYDFFGEKVKTVDAMGRATYFNYDTMGRVTKITRPVVTVGIVAFAENGSTGPESWTFKPAMELSTYDEMGNKLTQSNGSVTLPNGLFFVDPLRQDDTTPVSPVGMRYRYDLRGHVVDSILPLGQSTKTLYDALGKKVAEKDANGNVATWKYDYFGRLIGHTDIGGANYSYTYDNAGQLVRQTNTRGQDTSFQYDTAGQLRTATETLFSIPVPSLTIIQTIRYEYDLAGHRVLERTRGGTRTGSVVTDGPTPQDNHIWYDAQGRISRVQDTRVAMDIEYDLLGNRSRVHTSLVADAGADFSGAPGASQYRYFAYDRMNRQIVLDAPAPVSFAQAQALSLGDPQALGSVLGTQGRFLRYDQNGNRISDTHWADKRVVVSGHSNTVFFFDQMGRTQYKDTTYGAISAGLNSELYGYDARDRLQSIVIKPTDRNGDGDHILVDYRGYFNAGYLYTTGPFLPDQGGYADALGGNNGVIDGLEARTNHYDLNGRLISQAVFGSETNIAGGGIRKYYVDYGGTNPISGGNGYDAVGNLRQYSVRIDAILSEDVVQNVYAYTYDLAEGYQVKKIDGSSFMVEGGPGPFDPGTTTYIYDVNRNVIGTTSSTAQTEENRGITNDIMGHALYQSQKGNVVRQLVVNGEWMGRYGSAIDEKQPRDKDSQKPNFTVMADFSFGYQSVGPNYSPAAPGAYTVRAGDTLQLIAQGAYGDASLWYIIADANGLSGSEPLTPGQALTIPNRVGTVHNNSETYKPYDPSKIPGDTTPFLPSADGGCGGWGYILAVVLIVAVAVIISVVTYGAGTALAATLGGTLLASIAAGAVVGAIGAAVLSFSSQLIMMAALPSERREFSLGDVGKAALFGGIGGALSGALGGVTQSFSAAAANPAGTLSSRLAATAKLVGTQMAIAGATNIAGQGAMIALGHQEEFSWGEVGIAAVGAGVGTVTDTAVSGVLANMPGNGFFKQVVASTASNFAARTSMAVMHGGKIDYVMIAADSFGNALGNAIGKSYGRMQEEMRREQMYAEMKAQFQLKMPEMKITPDMLYGPVDDGVNRDVLYQGVSEALGGYGDALSLDLPALDERVPNRSMVVPSGSNLTRVGERLYNQRLTPGQLIALAKYNDIADPFLIRAGAEILAPDNIEELNAIERTKQDYTRFNANAARIDQIREQRAAQSRITTWSSGLHFLDPNESPLYLQRDAYDDLMFVSQNGTPVTSKYYPSGEKEGFYTGRHAEILDGSLLDQGIDPNLYAQVAELRRNGIDVKAILPRDENGGVIWMSENDGVLVPTEVGGGTSSVVGSGKRFNFFPSGTLSGLVNLYDAAVRSSYWYNRNQTVSALSDALKQQNDAFVRTAFGSSENYVKHVLTKAAANRMSDTLAMQNSVSWKNRFNLWINSDFNAQAAKDTVAIRNGTYKPMLANEMQAVTSKFKIATYVGTGYGVAALGLGLMGAYDKLAAASPEQQGRVLFGELGATGASALGAQGGSMLGTSAAVGALRLSQSFSTWFPRLGVLGGTQVRFFTTLAAGFVAGTIGAKLTAPNGREFGTTLYDFVEKSTLPEWQRGLLKVATPDSGVPGYR